ncbi:MAG TPA: CocE/NonD family hydrolase, partial [Gemmatimonadales bacterium]|nr:CocE/NonD family hydrolase [Gemmatimonadales bacterium]
DSAALDAAIPRLAEQAVAAYRDSNRVTMLDNRFRLQILAGHYADAAATMAEWRRAWMKGDTSSRGRAVNAQYEIYLEAKRLQDADRGSFAEAFGRAFRERLARLDDRTAGLVARSLSIPLPASMPPPWGGGSRAPSDTTVALAEAIPWLRSVQVSRTYAELGRLPGPLIREDDRRRYTMEADIPVKTPDGATVCAMVWRPRSAPGRLPALLQFTIYADTTNLVNDLRRNASNGYVAVIGFTRGKLCSPDRPVPYVYDGADATALIGWIAGRPWSNGKVGMYGGSYSGMSPWAAAKHRPAALKAIMVGAPVGPGIDVPMEGNIEWNFVYPWPFYTTNTKDLDTVTYNDRGRWFRLYTGWYASGRAYRDLDRIDGTPNPIWDEWLAHPTWDAYWQRMIPSDRELATMDIPVLQTAGYYFGGPGAAVFYQTRHLRANPRARHYLVFGPWDHLPAQRGVVNALGDTVAVLAGYEIDPVARIDIISDLRYPWFDWILKGGPRPALLQDRVNYEVVGANRWKHAPSISAMANGKLRLYLGAEPSGQWHRFSATQPAHDGSLTLTVDLRDRSDSNRIAPGGGLVDTVIDTFNSLTWISDPLPEATEINGLYHGHLELVANKRDFDFGIAVYELRRDGTYRQLPPFQSRASHVASLSERRLLTPGAREGLDFIANIRLAAHRFEAGSRIVMLLGVLRSPLQQINYGTGKNVSDETIADAGEPLTIRWSTRSWVEFPVWREGKR